MIKRNKPEEIIEVIQAFQEGKDIEVSDDGENPKCVKVNRENISFNFGNNTYRVAKEVLPEFPLYAKSRKTNSVVKFVNKYDGYILDSGSSPYIVGDYETNFISCFHKGTWEILSDYEEMELVEYFEVVGVYEKDYFVSGTLYTEEELKKYPEYIKTGRSFMLKKI